MRLALLLVLAGCAHLSPEWRQWDREYKLLRGNRTQSECLNQ